MTQPAHSPVALNALPQDARGDAELRRLASYARRASRRRGLSSGELAEDIADSLIAMGVVDGGVGRSSAGGDGLPALPFLEFLTAAGAGPYRIRIACDPNLKLPAAQLVAVGMIVSEALDNSLRHAFPLRREGDIWIRLFAAGGRMTLTVRDNGVGMPDLDPSGQRGRGLISALAEQLGGYARLGSVQYGGAEVLVMFPEAK